MICGDIGMASSVCYQLFLYRVELQRRRQQPELRQQTKIELTHGLITKCVERMKNFSLSELQALSSEVDFRKLMDQQLSKLKAIQRSFVGIERRQQTRGAAAAANILSHQMVTVQQQQRQQQHAFWPQQNNWQQPPTPMQRPQPPRHLPPQRPTSPATTPLPPSPSPPPRLPQFLYTQRSSYALHLQLEQCVVWESSPTLNNFCQQQSFMWQEQQQCWTSWYRSAPAFWNGWSGAMQPPFGASASRGARGWRGRGRGRGRGRSNKNHWTDSRQSKQP